MNPLWTPYSMDEPVDLRTRAVKPEPASPSPVCALYSSGAVQQELYHYDTRPGVLHYAPMPGPSSAPTPPVVYGPISPYPPCNSAVNYPMTSVPVPFLQYPTVPQVSPASTSSSSRSSAGGYPIQPTLSPPISPPSEITKSLFNSPEFKKFEHNALQTLANKKGGKLLSNNPRMRRPVRTTKENAADESYRTQRERNNLAAKKSRDRRKIKEINLVVQVTYLSNLVAKLQSQLANRQCPRCHQRCVC